VLTSAIIISDCAGGFGEFGEKSSVVFTEAVIG